MAFTTAELEKIDPKIASTSNAGKVQQGGKKNGYPLNGFTGETVEAVREATEKFFIEKLHKSPKEAKQRAELITAGWALDLELSEE